MGGRISRKTQVARRFFQLRKTFDVDTQQLRTKAIKRLEELFNLSSDFARGTYKFQYTNGKREVLTVKQRQIWARIAAYIAQIMNTIANGIDERQIDKDLVELEKLVNEATAKNSSRRTKTNRIRLRVCLHHARKHHVVQEEEVKRMRVSEKGWRVGRNPTRVETSPTNNSLFYSL